MRKGDLFALAIALAGINLSCEISEPEQFYNEGAKPPQEAEIIFDNLKEGQRLSGYYYIRVDTASIENKVIGASLYLNNQRVYTSKPFGFLHLNTRNFPDGQYELKIGIELSIGRGKGIWSEFDEPDIYCVKNIIIDNSPPPPATLKIVSGLGEKPRLSWNKTDDNIYAYLIYRTDSIYSRDYTSWMIIDTIYNPDITEFYDENFNLPYGLNIKYKIGASKNAQFDSIIESNAIEFEIGKIAESGSCLSFLNNDEILLVGDDKLIAYSLPEQKILRILNLPKNIKFDEGMYVLNPGRTELYCHDLDKLYAIDLVNFTIKRTVEISFMNVAENENIWLQSGEENKVILSQKNIIAIADLNSGEAEKTFRQISNIYAPPFISIDKTKLYALSYDWTDINNATGTILSVLDLTAAQSGIIQKRPLPARKILGIYNSKLYIVDDFVQSLYSINVDDIDDLKYEYLSSPIIAAYMPDGEYFYTSNYIEDGKYSLVYGESDFFGIKKWWVFRRKITNVFLSPDKKNLIASLETGKTIYIKL